MVVAAKASQESADLRELRWQVANYRSLHARVLEREKALKRQVEELGRGVRERDERIAALLQEAEVLRARQAWLEQQVFPE